MRLKLTIDDVVIVICIHFIIIITIIIVVIAVAVAIGKVACTVGYLRKIVIDLFLMRY